MSYSDFTKAEKKLVHQIIDKGLRKEFATGLTQVGNIIKQWEQDNVDTKETYYKVFDAIRKFDKHIARRYDDMRGSTYIYVLAAQLADNVISVSDFEGFRQEVIDQIVRLSNPWDE